MQRCAIRFSLCWMLTMVALVGSNLAAGIATSQYYPRPRNHQVAIMYGRGSSTIAYRPDGSIVRYEGGLENDRRPLSSRPFVFIQPPSPPPPSLLRIWSPVIASARRSRCWSSSSPSGAAWRRRAGPPSGGRAG